MTSTTVTLTQPITVGDTPIETITIREPRASDLMGLSLLEILQLNITAHAKLLTRITTPTVTEAQISACSLSDCLKLMRAVTDFLDTGPDGSPPV